MDNLIKAEEKWDIYINGTKNNYGINISELWRYRDLLMMFVKKDIITVYKQTILGPIWFVLQPILTTLIFVILFGNIAKLCPTGVPPFAFFLISITLWSYFSDTLNITSKTFTENANVFGKVYFPRLILPLSKVLSGFIKFLLQFGFFLIFWFYYLFVTKQIFMNWEIIFTPFLLLIMITLALGFGIIITSLTTKYRDLTFLITFAVQLLMYATPVAYSMSDPKMGKYKFYIWLNPLTSIFEAFKYSFLNKGEFSLIGIAYSTLFSIVILLIGILVFNKVEKSFVDTV